MQSRAKVGVRHSRRLEAHRLPRLGRACWSRAMTRDVLVQWGIGGATALITRAAHPDAAERGASIGFVALGLPEAAEWYGLMTLPASL